MLTPKRFSNLSKAFHNTKHAGIHDTIMPPPKSFASELSGLLSLSTLHDNMTPMNTKVKQSYMRALPLRFHSALREWALVTREKVAYPLDHNPKYLNYWSEDPHARVLGAIPSAFLSKFSGFSVLMIN